MLKVLTGRSLLFAGGFYRAVPGGSTAAGGDAAQLSHSPPHSDLGGCSQSAVTAVSAMRTERCGC